MQSQRFTSLIFLSIAPLAASDDVTKKHAIAATVNGEAITSAQVEAALRPQMAAIEERTRQLREPTLNKLIDNALIEQAARAEGLNTDEFLRRHVESVTVTTSAVDEAYNRSREQFPGILPAEAKYRIRRTLEDNARANALNALLGKLRSQAVVTNQIAINAVAALRAAAQEGPSAGNPAAPVTIVEFSDFECPYCRAAQPLVKRVLDRWPEQVRLVFKHFPLDQHPNAVAAAKAAVCADRQRRFWPVHNTIFQANQLNVDFLRTLAGRADLNIAEFETCVTSEEVMDYIRKDIVLGRMAGVAGTPAFFVNGQLVSRADALETAVEKAIGASK